MKLASIVGILLIILGVIGLIYGGITYTKDEKKAEIGGLEIRVEEEETIPLPPVLGVVSLVGGIVLLVVGSRAASRT